MFRPGGPNDVIFKLSVLIAYLALVITLVVGALAGTYYAVNYLLTLPAFK